MNLGSVLQMVFKRNKLDVKQLLITAGIGFFVLSPLFLIIIEKRNSPEPSQEKISNASADELNPTPTLILLAYNSLYDQVLTPGTVPTAAPLDPNEQSYHQANPQYFPFDPALKGTLVVTSEVSNLNVTLEPMGVDNYRSAAMPFNTAPFKFPGIPAGYYIASAAHDNYEARSFNVLVEPDKITRLNIYLNPK